MNVKSFLVAASLLASSMGVSYAADTPVFSNGDAEQWYFVTFKVDDVVMEDMGADKYVLTQKIKSDNAAQQWKLVGNADEFYLQSANGNVLTYTDFFTTSLVPDGTSDASTVAAKLALHHSPLTDFTDAWEIEYKDKGDASNRLNTYGGTGLKLKICAYAEGELNNLIEFVPVESVPASVQAASIKEFKVNGSSTYMPENPLTMWYKKPVTLSTEIDPWMQSALPFGNGQFGATAFGGIHREQIQFNEKTLWTGSTHLRGSYQNFGFVYIEDISDVFGNDEASAVQDYVLNLQMEDATVNVHYASPDGAVKYSRHYLSSHPDGVIAMKLTASEAGKINVRLRLSNGIKIGYIPVNYADGKASFQGKLHWVDFKAAFQAVPVGGEMTTNDDNIEVKNADELYIILAGATNFDQHAPNYLSDAESMRADVDARIAAAVSKGWDDIYADHVRDYKSLFDRVKFVIDGTINNLPTDEMIDNYNKRRVNKTAPEVLMLEQMYYNYGRYLLIGSARGMDTPANLQGIWNNSASPAWQCDIHSNINVQMNYWPSEITNLSELHTNFLNYVYSMAVEHNEWKEYAQRSGQSEGWTCFTQNNIFGHSDYAENYVIANAWYTSHFWQHYRYTQDRDFLLNKALPVMLSCTKFWLERLIQAEDGSWVAPQEWSPEHGPAAEDGTAHAQQLVYDLFKSTLLAIDELGADANVSGEFVAELKEKFDGLDTGLAIEIYDGSWGDAIAPGTEILREWKYSPFSVGENKHRHQSHLMCLYPFDQINSESPYFEAALNSLRLRGDVSTGWSLAWRMNLWARALDGDHCHTIVRNALKHSNSYVSSSSGISGVYYNLFDAHPPFQIDGNFGVTAGMTEMLLQSYSGVIQLLPALPVEWAAGSIEGLKAVGNFTIDQKWEDGKLTQAVIVSSSGRECVVDYPEIGTATVRDDSGSVVKYNVISDHRISFSTEQDAVYTIYNDGGAGIDGIEVDNSNAPVEYYNIQGMRINNPTGLYIEKQGTKVTKRINIQ